MTAGMDQTWSKLEDWLWRLPRWLPIALWGVVVYLLLNLRKPGILSPGLDLYVVQPAIWLSLAGVGYLAWRFGVGRKPQPGRRLVLIALLLGAFQVSLLVLAGLIFGFGHSPYGHRPLILIGNLFFAGAILLGMELTRAALMQMLGRKSLLLAVLTGSLFYTWLGIPLARWAAISGVGGVLRFSGTILIPRLSENLLASFLSLLGGPLPALAYRVVLQAFEWLSPVLPNPGWMTMAFLGTIAPAVGLVLVWSEFSPEQSARSMRSGLGSSKAWILVAVIAVSLLWFNTGLFGVQPTLVSGMSMFPVMQAGDLAILRYVDAAKIEVGDIIRFKQNNVFVLHRVWAIEGHPGALRFITRGDANNVDDPPVLASSLSGRVIAVVPRVGWLGIWTRNFIHWIGGIR